MAISCGVPSRARGTWPASISGWSAGALSRMGVWVTPGATALTRMFWVAYSRAATRVTITDALLEAYPLELRRRAVRMAAEVRPDYDTEWAAMKAVAAKLGSGATETLRKWVRQDEIDAAPGRDRRRRSPGRSRRWRRRSQLGVEALRWPRTLTAHFAQNKRAHKKKLSCIPAIDNPIEAMTTSKRFNTPYLPT